MSARKLSSNGLTALVVVLLALAVIVLAGARVPLDQVVTHTKTLKVYVSGTSDATTSPSTTTTTVARRARTDGEAAAGTGVGGTHVADTAPATTPGATTTTAPRATTTTPATTTTAPTSTTTTTVEPTPATAAPSSLTGIFEGGRTSETERVGAVRTLTVTVPPGVHVTLSVTCGLTRVHASATRSATVHVLSEGASCVASFSVPASSPEPARWELTAS